MRIFRVYAGRYVPLHQITQAELNSGSASNKVSVVKTSPGRDGGQTTTQRTYEESLVQTADVQIGEQLERS